MARSNTNPGAAAAQTDQSPTSPSQAPTGNGRDIARRAYNCIWQEDATQVTMSRTGCRRSENCKNGEVCGRVTTRSARGHRRAPRVP